MRRIRQNGVPGDFHLALDRAEVHFELDFDQRDERAAALLKVPLRLRQLCPSSDVKGVAAREMGSDARAPLFLHGQAVRRGRSNLGGLIFSRKIGILHGNNLLGCSGPGQTWLFSFGRWCPWVPLAVAYLRPLTLADATRFSIQQQSKRPGFRSRARGATRGSRHGPFGAASSCSRTYRTSRPNLTQGGH